MWSGAEEQQRGRSGAFVQQLTGCQSRLYAYVCALLGGSADAGDVLQETNLVLWSKADEFDPQRPFLPWAYRFAYLQVLAHRKRRQRSRLVLDDLLLEQVAQEYHRHDADADGQLAALDGCVGKLAPEQRDLLTRRYTHNESVMSLADRLGQSPNVVSASLYRIRKALLRCLEATLARETYA
jgi:RNA polymerase sigma-70 factor (ECF subfamily)